MYQLRRFRAGHHPADLRVDGTDALKAAAAHAAGNEIASLFTHCVPQAGSGRLNCRPFF
jgi:hypothetical protein